MSNSILSWFFIITASLAPLAVAADTSENSPAVSMTSGDQALDDYLASTLPDWLIVSDIRSKELSEGNGGHMSVAGTLITAQNLVGPVNGHTGLARHLYMEEVSAPGVIDAGIAMAIGTLKGMDRPMYREFIVTVTAGTEFAFSGELPFLEAVDGRSYSGQVHHGVPSVMPGQIPENLIPQNGYVVGGLHFDDIVDNVLTNVITLDMYLNGEALTPYYDGLVRYGKPMILTSYDQPLIDFKFPDVATPKPSLGIQYKGGTLSYLLPARLEIDYELEAMPYPHAEQKYQDLAKDPNLHWYMTLIIPIEDRSVEKVAIQIRNSSGGQLQTHYSKPMAWNGQYFEFEAWKFYAHD